MFFPNRQIQYKGKFADGYINGDKVELFSSSGGLRYQGGVNKGMYDGDAIFYHQNGGICIKGKFVDGELNDDNVEMFFESGALFYKGNMKNGRREGLGRLFYDIMEGKVNRGIFGNSCSFVNPFMSINSGSGYFPSQNVNNTPTPNYLTLIDNNSNNSSTSTLISAHNNHMNDNNNNNDMNILRMVTGLSDDNINITSYDVHTVNSRNGNLDGNSQNQD